MAEAAVVGVPDHEWGEAVAAAVVVEDGAEVTEDELQAWVRARLRSTKTPEFIEFRAELPYNETGKLLRRVLREELSASLTTVGEATFEDADGVKVGYRRWMPSAPAGIVLVLHGASEHGGGTNASRPPSPTRVGRSTPSTTGGTGARQPSTGRGIIGPGGIDGVLSDVDELRRLAVDELGNLPVAVFGHSMGSLVALGYVARAGRGLVGCVLSGSPGVAAEGLADLTSAMRQAADAGHG